MFACILCVIKKNIEKKTNYTVLPPLEDIHMHENRNDMDEDYDIENDDDCVENDDDCIENDDDCIENDDDCIENGEEYIEYGEEYIESDKDYIGCNAGDDCDCMHGFAHIMPNFLPSNLPSTTQIENTLPPKKIVRPVKVVPAAVNSYDLFFVCFFGCLLFVVCFFWCLLHCFPIKTAYKKNSWCFKRFCRWDFKRKIHGSWAFRCCKTWKKITGISRFWFCCLCFLCAIVRKEKINQKNKTIKKQ